MRVQDGRNRRSGSPGTGDHLPPESVFTIRRNRCSGSIGIGVQDRSEYAPTRWQGLAGPRHHRPRHRWTRWWSTWTSAGTPGAMTNTSVSMGSTPPSGLIPCAGPRPRRSSSDCCPGDRGTTGLGETRKVWADPRPPPASLWSGRQPRSAQGRARQALYGRATDPMTPPICSTPPAAGVPPWPAGPAGARLP
jgi:hypothetical protein